MHQHFTDASACRFRNAVGLVAKGCPRAMDNYTRSRAYSFGESPGLERSARRSPVICKCCDVSKLPPRYQVADAGRCVVQPPSSSHTTTNLPGQPVVL